MPVEVWKSIILNHTHDQGQKNLKKLIENNIDFPTSIGNL